MRTQHANSNINLICTFKNIEKSYIPFELPNYYNYSNSVQNAYRSDITGCLRLVTHKVVNTCLYK